MLPTFAGPVLVLFVCLVCLQPRAVWLCTGSCRAVCCVLQVKDAKVDTLVMKHFLSGFSDDDAKLILKHCKEVLPKEANILLLQVWDLM
jgi:hypothetical protein